MLPNTAAAAVDNRHSRSKLIPEGRWIVQDAEIVEICTLVWNQSIDEHGKVGWICALDPLHELVRVS